MLQENVCSGVKESKMDKCKVYVKLQVSVVESNEDAEKFKDRPNKTSYSRVLTYTYNCFIEVITNTYEYT